MEISVIVFPGSNCDRDIAVSLKKFSKQKPKMVWHKERSLPKSDLIVLPGGFSYGDYLRCGSMAANSPIMSEVIKNAESGAYIIGICNGFQILTETNLLPDFTSVLLKQMPESISAGNTINLDFKPLCKPIPSKIIGLLTVVCKSLPQTAFKLSLTWSYG